jgi:hypothetical protein
LAWSRASGRQCGDIPLRGALSLTQIPVDVYPRVPATVDFLKVGEFDKKLGGTVCGLMCMSSHFLFCFIFHLYL